MTVCHGSLLFEGFFNAGVDNEVGYELVFSEFGAVDPNVNEFKDLD